MVAYRFDPGPPEERLRLCAEWEPVPYAGAWRRGLCEREDDRGCAAPWGTATAAPLCKYRPWVATAPQLKALRLVEEGDDIPARLRRSLEALEARAYVVATASGPALTEGGRRALEDHTPP